MNASRDENNVTSLLGASPTAGIPPIPIYADPDTHRLLVQGIGDDGPTGPQGPTGPTGPQGPTGSIGGSGTINQVAYFTGASTISSSPNLTFDGNNLGIPQTTATAGIIYQGSNTLLHTYFGAGGDANIFLGQNTGNFTNTGGGGNVILGNRSFGAATTYRQNIAIGVDIGLVATTGSNNILIGNSVVEDGLTTGSFNILIGDQVGVNNGVPNSKITTESGNILIGGRLSIPVNGVDNQLSIGNLIFGTNMGFGGRTISTGGMSIGVFPDSTKRLLVKSINSASSSYALTLTNSSDLVGFAVRSDLRIEQSGTVTPASITGDQTINKSIGSVNFAAAATSITVTNSLVTTLNDVIQITIRTDDLTMKSAVAVFTTPGEFTIIPNAAPTGEVRVDFEVKSSI